VAGLIAALLLRLRDPQQAKPRYSWEDTDEDAAWDVNNPEHAMLEPPPPRQVPVLWQHQDDGSQSVVLHFPPRERPPGA
ncbi:rhomboid family intramembrane serine protease, partial [Xanthomonas oryzae pv. oryzae]